MSIYPYVESHQVWGHDIRFTMNSSRTESWYGIKGYLERANNNVNQALTDLNNWNVFLQKMIKVGDVVIDCGANEGHTTVVFAKQVGPTGKVIALEADANNIELIQKNIALNGLTNVEVFHKIISERSGDHKRFKYEVVQTNNEGDLVETACLDDFAHFKPNVIKIDIEGYELPALQGATRLLESGVALEIELHVSGTTGIHMTRRFGFNPHDLMKLLKSYGYTIMFDYREVAEGEIPTGCIRCFRPEKTN
jgi:FkbM family methyltransferase